MKRKNVPELVKRLRSSEDSTTELLWLLNLEAADALLALTQSENIEMIEDPRGYPELVERLRDILTDGTALLHQHDVHAVTEAADALEALTGSKP
jgi:hypothetical protein